MDAEKEVALSARQRGDFQTPRELARQVWGTVDAGQFDLVIEPTFGLGAFIETMPSDCKANVLGWEIHEDYYRSALSLLSANRPNDSFNLSHRDVFSVTPNDITVPAGSAILVIGNPPWVTNAEQGSLGGSNTGKKHNFKLLSGLDAMTGRSNFDISEAIIIHLIKLFYLRGDVAQFALLAKFSVLRNIMQFFGQQEYIGAFEYHKIDTLRYFDVQCDAGLLKFQVNGEAANRQRCSIFQGVAGEKQREIGFVDGALVYDLEAYERSRFMKDTGVSSYTWRQGVKHDASNILELTETNGVLHNKSGEVADIEQETLFQLYKSSDIFHGRKSRFVLPIYQHSISDPMNDLEERFPKLFNYLQSHEAGFRARKSSVYQGRPPFTMFGIGDYTFMRYKVAIGGLYPEPVFRLLGPAPRPVALDDTSYMLATNSYEEAVYLLALLNLECTRAYLCSISHPGEKRRFSKDVLGRLLIPPMSKCPDSIRSALFSQWLSKHVFSQETMRQLQDWLVEYVLGSIPFK